MHLQKHLKHTRAFAPPKPLTRFIASLSLIGMIVTTFLPVVSFAEPDHPSWWSSGVTNGNAPENLGIANLGQLKNVANVAHATLNALLETGAGYPTPFTVPDESDRDDAWYLAQKQAANLGQLKAVAKPFYDRLNGISPDWVKSELNQNGLTQLGVDYFQDSATGYFYPWNPATPVEENYQPATVGQLKLVFSLRLSTLSIEPSDDENENGIPDALEAILNGIQLTGAQRYLPTLSVTDTWEVTALDYLGNPLVNQNVIFRVIEGNGSFPGGSSTTQLTTDSSGKANIDSFNASQTTDDKIMAVINNQQGSATAYLPSDVNGNSPSDTTDIASGKYIQTTIQNPDPPVNGGDLYIKELNSYIRFDYHDHWFNFYGIHDDNYVINTQRDPLHQVYMSEWNGEHFWYVDANFTDEIKVYIPDDLRDSGNYEELKFINDWNISTFKVSDESEGFDTTIGENDAGDYFFLNFDSVKEHQAYTEFDLLIGAENFFLGNGDMPERDPVYDEGYSQVDVRENILMGAQFSGITVDEHNTRTLFVPRKLEDQDTFAEGGIYKTFTLGYSSNYITSRTDFKITISWEYDKYLVQYYDEEQEEWILCEDGEAVVGGSLSTHSISPESCDFRIAAKKAAFFSFGSEFTMVSEYRPNFNIDADGNAAVSGDYIELEEVSINLIPNRGLGVNINTEEASSPKYRKIGLNGLPISDSKPQGEAESDEESEETFVDALSLDLQHSVTDIYIPVPSSDLALSVRRNASSTTWTKYSGLRPSEQPDAPFGAGWSSNVTSYVVLNEQTDADGNLVAGYNQEARKEKGLSQSSPNTATVIDENGSAYSFIIGYGENGRTFSPTPTARTQLPSYMAVLTEENDSLSFSKKFGTTLTFGGGPVFDVANNRVEGSKQLTQSTYQRLQRVEDRTGAALLYEYETGDTDNLIPNTISVEGRPNLKINVEHDINGEVTRVQDSNGNIISYGYDTVAIPGDVEENSVSILHTVSKGSSVQTTYGYSAVVEPDHKATSTPLGHDLRDRNSEDELYDVLTGHVNLASIDGPYSNDTISFEYEFDLSRRPFSVKPEYMFNIPTGEWVLTGNYIAGNYTLSGLSRNVRKITLPGGRTTELAGDHQIVSDSSGEFSAGIRQTTVTDPEENQRVYSWGDHSTVTIPNEQLDYMDKELSSISIVQILGMSSMSIIYSGEGVSGTEEFEFDPGAGYEVLSVTDFCENPTTYTYEDPVPGHPMSMRHSDPTSQTNAEGDTKSFTYDDTTRIMTEITDELGRRTVYGLDEDLQVSFPGDLGRRTTETKYDENDNPIARTKFYYGNTTFPKFMTKKVVEAFGLNSGNDPSWVTPLTSLYVPDIYGRVSQEITDLDADGIASSNGEDLIVTHSYDLNGNKLSSTDARGNKTGFTYDSQNRLTKVTHSDGSTKSIAYDHRSKKVMETDEEGVRSGYFYDSTGRLTLTVRDMNGNLSYNIADNTFSGIDDEDITTYTTYNDVDSPETTTDPRGYITKMVYDGLQRPVKIITPREDTAANVVPNETTGYVTEMEYSTLRNTGGSAFNVSGFKPTKSIDPRGYESHVEYDSLYRPVRQWTQYQKGTSAKYALGETEYDALGNVTSTTNYRTPADENGNLGSSSVTHDTLVTETAYDELNRPVTVTKASGATSVESTDTTDYTSTGLAFRNTQEITATVHRETETEYDAAGRPVITRGPPVYDAISDSEKRPVTTTAYDGNGNAISTVNPLGNTWLFSYDSRNRKIQEIQPAVTDTSTGQSINPVITMAYDLAGNVTSTTDARLFTTTMEYDNAYRVTRTVSPQVYVNGSENTLPIVTSQTYDKAGNILTATDGNYHVTVNTYDSLGRLSATKTNPVTTASSATHAQDIIVTNTYDAAGNLTNVEDGEGQQTGFSYDGLNRKLATIWDVNDLNRLKTEETVYDAMLATEQRNPNQNGAATATFSYDARFRLTQASYPSRPIDDTVIGYDLADRKLGVTHPNAPDTLRDTGYVYDNLDRTTSETSAGITHGYTYDLAGNIKTTSYGNGGRTITSQYDSLNRLASLTEGNDTTYYAYDLGGNATLKTLPSGQLTKTGYDALGRAAYISNEANGSVLNSFDYDFDAVGNVTKVLEIYPGGSLPNRIVENAYDNANRLHIETIDDGSGAVETEYSYNKANNRLSRDVTGGDKEGLSTYVYGTAGNGFNSNQVVSYTDHDGKTSTYLYDDNGNRATKSVDGTPAQIYHYDLNNRLVTVTDAQLGDYTYRYDARTRRVSRDETAAAGTSTVLSFSAGLSVQEYENGNTTTPPNVEHIRGSDYGGGIGGILYTRRGGIPSYNVYNSRGDVVSKVSELGNITWEAAYEAFGTRTAENGSTEDRQKANTKDEDPTGLLNEGMRYRDLEAGIFITRDPAGFVDGPNVYTYVRQNPWSKFDPYGLDDAVIYSINKGETNYGGNSNSQTNKDFAEGFRMQGTGPLQSDFRDYQASYPGNRAQRMGQAVRDIVTIGGMIGGRRATSGGPSFKFPGGPKLAPANGVSLPVPAVKAPTLPVAVTAPNLHSESKASAESPTITQRDVSDKTRTEIRKLADEKGLKPVGDKSSPDYPRKWKDPVTDKERLRLDRGHIDPKTNKPYNNPKAAKDHVHAYEPDGKTKVKVDNDPHIPTTGE